MLRPSTILRLLTIQRVLLRYGLDEIVTATHLFRPLRYFSPGWWRRNSHDESLGVRLRMALIELGPIFVKFGQSLSTRPDLLPKELSGQAKKCRFLPSGMPCGSLAKIPIQPL